MNHQARRPAWVVGGGGRGRAGAAARGAALPVPRGQWLRERVREHLQAAHSGLLQRGAVIEKSLKQSNFSIMDGHICYHD